MRLAFVVASLLATPIALATPPVAPGTDQAVVDGNAAGDVRGLAAVNVAAGNSNVQANVRVMAAATTVDVVARAVQTVDASRVDATREARALIGAGAFGDARGAVALNQAAGGANAQANVLALAMGGGDIGLAIGQQVDAAVLASTAAGNGLDPSMPAAHASLREARIDPAAFGQASGVLQVNQTAGVGNTSANAIVLQLPGGTP